MSDPSQAPRLKRPAPPQCLFITRESSGAFSVGWVSASGCRYYASRRCTSYEAAYVRAGLMRVTVHGGLDVPLREGRYGERCGAEAMIERESWEGKRSP